MIRILLASLFVLGVLGRSVSAQVIPAPLSATIVNFDDIPGASDGLSITGPVTTEYASRGLIFSGFPPLNGGGVVALGNGMLPEISGTNFMLFVSAFPMLNGGLPQSPEFLTFYPPVTSVQFDIGTFNIDCSNTMELFVEAFAPDGTSLGVTDAPVPITGSTVALSAPPPGIQKVVITSTHTCGPPGFTFHGVELFTIDNVAYIPVASNVSKCAQGALDAAGKKAKAEASCYSKALANGLPVDSACLQKVVDTFNKSFAKAQAVRDCLTTENGASVESAVDGMIASALQMVTGGASGPDVCFGKKLSAIGKKAQSVATCFSKAAKAGAVPDEACVQKAATAFNASLKICGNPTQLGPIETLIDNFATSLSRAVTIPTTTTVTTSTTTTTSPPPPLGEHLSFTTTAGTSNCTLGDPSNDPPTPAPPFSGELDSDTAGTMKVSNLGLGCLYIGGGAATVAPSLIPENATTILDSDGTNLFASSGTGRADCSRGPSFTSHCVNNPPVACSSDADCFAPGGCAADANCYFGPPVPVNGFPASCVVNTFASDASGTVDTSTGASTVNIQLGSRVFLSLALPTACPICAGGFCSYGANAGAPCTTTNSSQTTLDCMPNPGTFVATLPVNLSPLTTDSLTATAADGLFCPDQVDAGAFGQATTQAITQHGSPSGDLTDGLPHASTLVSNFCIPPTGSLALDGIADLPGPGSLSLPGNAQFVTP
jgi:hypothetical protein